MKRVKNIYEKICDFDNIYNAYLNARKGKRFRDDVLKFSANVEENIIDIQNELLWGTYKVGRYKKFTITDPKKRLIMALQFKDRVVQWAIYQQIAPIFDKGFIYDSYGCRDFKGTHKAVERLQYWLRKNDRKPKKGYYLKLDISKFFYSVDHGILLDILSKKIADKKTLELLSSIINSEDTDFGLPEGFIADYIPEETESGEKGLPIGNLTSQMFANIYMNEVDQFCKQKLKIHNYIRYMDDIIILDDNKKRLNLWKNEIELFVNKRLKLRLNNKTAIRPINMGIEFVGYRIWPTHRKLRKSTVLKMKARFREVQYLYSKGLLDYDEIRSITASYYGLMKHCNSYNLRKKISDTVVFKRDSGKCGDIRENTQTK